MSKVIVVTGTASGMGKATVDKFAAEGWNVVATVRKEADLTVHEGNPRVKTLLLDVDDEQAAPAFAQQALGQFGRVDALVNNAGYYQMGPIESTSLDQIHRQFQTNVFGLIAVTKAFLPHFRRQRSGVIVNISSLTAEQGYPYSAAYAASKAAVATFSEGLSMEMAEFGVVVRAIIPGQHATRIFTKIDVASGIDEEYQPGIESFFAATPLTGSLPHVTADVIYQAVVDPQTTRVRYYSGPDSTAIPEAKRILGPQQYWEEFRQAAVGRPSALFRTLVPVPGPEPLEREV
ncbi:SDR family NAD(P)-dependent oxidoreductase [Kibdelosporangium aridum]|uniref:NADP-dependent 3-hydroxy acid dehydrogenase YdfG n=1 Tax=Kibdelosporangium aridum TaxID=2030 RepID=A0A1Y5Y4M5_KIBAR|nr:SDR family NAD(P)-dependent oxidoreductase [Kibdelosporangium aridum]SMD25763.1 NADP-dependent 3-hydroxy acid dehydrogenase YdfG [Kibdelosporangium aridum]